MSAQMDEDDEVCFIYQEDPECRSASQLKDVRIGESFIYMGKKLTKRNQYGWFMGICNVVDEDGNVSHLHPTTRINLLN